MELENREKTPDDEGFNSCVDAEIVSLLLQQQQQQEQQHQQQQQTLMSEEMGKGHGII